MKEKFEALRGLSEKEQYDKVREIYEEYRKEMSERVTALFKEKGLYSTYVAADIGISGGMMSRMLKKGFVVPIRSLPILSNSFLNESCHETIFLGDKETTILPPHLAMLAKEFSKPELKKQCDELLTKSRALYKADTINKKLPVRNASEIVRDRIREIADSKFVIEIDAFGETIPSLAKVSIRKFQTDDEYEGAVPTLVYYSYVYRTTLDYFLTQDYTAFTSIGYRDDEDRLVVVGKKSVISIISNYLRISEESQAELLGTAYAMLLKNR